MSSEPAEPPSPALLAAELDRIAASDSFARSARQVRFLRHLVAATQAGDAAALREMALGMDVFLRDPARSAVLADLWINVGANLGKRLAPEAAAEREAYFAAWQQALDGAVERFVASRREYLVGTPSSPPPVRAEIAPASSPSPSSPAPRGPASFRILGIPFHVADRSTKPDVEEVR